MQQVGVGDYVLASSRPWFSLASRPNGEDGGFPTCCYRAITPRSPGPRAEGERVTRERSPGRWDTCGSAPFKDGPSTEA